MAKFRYSEDELTWTDVTAALEYSIPGTTAGDDVYVRGISATVSLAAMTGALVAGTNPDGSMTVENLEDGAFSVTVSGSSITAFNGTYTTTTAGTTLTYAGLASGPLHLVKAGYTGTATAGNTITLRNPLAVYDADGGVPFIGFQMTRSGVDLPGETGPTYDVEAADEVFGLAVESTATHAFGAGDGPVSADVIAVAPYVEQVTRFTGTSVALNATANYNTVGGTPFDITNQWGFFKCKIPTSNLARVIQPGNFQQRIGIRANDIEMFFRMADSSAIVFFDSANTYAAGDTIAVLFEVGNNAYPNKIFINKNNTGWASAGTFAVSASSTSPMDYATTVGLRFTGATGSDTWDFSRTVEFVNTAAPDFTDPAVQQTFLKSDGTLADPALSLFVYGQAHRDVYGDAATLNAFATANKGTGPAFSSVTGSITDV
jgi:hypothetical protein